MFKMSLYYPDIHMLFYSLRDDTVYKYYEDADIISVRFVKISGVISHSKEVVDEVLVSYDHDNKIVSVEIHRALKNLSCHLFDTQIEIDNKPPLHLYPIHHKVRDELRVYFHSFISSTITTFEKSEEEGIEIIMNDEKKKSLIFFYYKYNINYLILT